MRFYEKRAARRYTHMCDWRHCRYWWCLGCHWRRVTGQHNRNKQRAIARSHEMAKTLTPVKYRRDTDGHFRRVEDESCD